MEYILKRSKRKTLSLQITPEAVVVVRAPNWAAARDIERFVETHHSWITEHVEKQRLYNEMYPKPTEEEIVSLKKQATEIIPQRVAYYAAVMGLIPSAVKITAARTRFGSCSAYDSLNFSYYLMRYPMEAIDYVVVHELAHILHKNHGKAFYELVALIIPDWKARRALLKKF